MAKITKRAVDALQSASGRDVFVWDSELRGFGVRVKPSGVRTFLIQYRNVEGRTRRLVLGQYGALTPENARDLAREKLAGVAKGEDPSAERHAVRAGMSVSEVCDWYLEEAEAGRILGRNRRPIKASTLKMDRSRIETHIKPLLGARLVSGLTLRDIEGMQADIAAGKSARGRKAGRGGKSTGGSGVASRTVGTLRGLLGHAARLKIVGKNPAEGVRQLAVERRQRRLSDDELRHLGQYHADPSRRGRTSDRPRRHPNDAAVRVSSNGSVGAGAQLGQPSRPLRPLPRHEERRSDQGSRRGRDIMCRNGAWTGRLALRVPGRLGRRPFHWGRPGLGSSLHEGEPEGCDAPRSSTHFRQRGRGSRLLGTDDRWASRALGTRSDARLCPFGYGTSRRG